MAVLTPRHCPPAPAPRERSRWLAKALPGLQTLQLVVDANRTPRATPPYLLQQMVEPFLGSSALRSFALTFRTWCALMRRCGPRIHVVLFLCRFLHGWAYLGPHLPGL